VSLNVLNFSFFWKICISNSLYFKFFEHLYFKKTKNYGSTWDKVGTL